MKKLMGITTLVVAILISAIAGYFSIVGLAALFAARAIPVIIMGTALEVGKLVAATWLKLNWKERTVAKLHKGYLLVATVVLMLITSLGIFGFLSAGHLEQNAPLAGLSIQSQQFQTQLDQTTANNKRIEGRLAQIDTNINAFLTAGSATKGLRASTALKVERDTLAAEMEANNKTINDLNTKLAPIKQQSTEVEAKLGPVKFVAQALGYEDPEVAVRIIIMLIISAFDPLAVILILSAMATFAQLEAERKAREDAIEVAKTIPESVVVIPPVEISGSAPVMVEPIAHGIAEEPVEEEKIVTRLSPTEIADRMAEAAPVPDLTISGDVPVVIEAEATANAFAPAPKPEPVPDDPKEIRNLLLDIMEQYPDIVNELLATAKEMEASPTTISTITGGVVND